MIPYGLHQVDNKDIIEVKKVLKSNFLTQGPKVKLFEKQIQNICKSNFCSTTTSASVALYLACRALDLKKGDLFWTVPNTFVASANAGLLCGAKVDFVDIDPATNNICIKKLKHKLEKSKIKPKYENYLFILIKYFHHYFHLDFFFFYFSTHCKIYNYSKFLNFVF